MLTGTTCPDRMALQLLTLPWPHPSPPERRDQGRDTRCDSREQQRQQSTGVPRHKTGRQSSQEMFFLLSGLILLAGTSLRWFHSHTAAERWLNQRTPILFFLILVVIFVASGMRLNVLGASPSRAWGRDRGPRGARDARPRNAAHGSNHFMVQVKCLPKWASQYRGSTQYTS